MRLRRDADGSGFVRSVVAGAVSGAVAAWVMERAQSRISELGSERTKQREKEAQGDAEPATYRAAEAAASALHVRLPDERKPQAGELFHFATGIGWGALLGAVSHLLRTRGIGSARGVLPGLAFGAAVWLVSDELLVPALGLSRRATAYPPSTHAKGLAAHLVYGATAGTGLRLLA